MLMKADIMLLDEPTNHLDVKNVAWLEGYLTSLTNVTSMIVSHDSGFLDHVCTDIIHYEDRKLKRYRVRAPLPTPHAPAARPSPLAEPCRCCLLLQVCDAWEETCLPQRLLCTAPRRSRAL